MFKRNKNPKKLFNRISLLFVFLIIQLSGIANPEFDFFEKRIRPVLSKNCYECHSAKSKSLKAAAADREEIPGIVLVIISG